MYHGGRESTTKLRSVYFGPEDTLHSQEVRTTSARCTHANCDRATLSALLGRDRVRKTEVGTPVAPADGDDAELRNDDCGTDSRGNFLGSLDAKANMALRVADDDDSLETSPLAGAGLLLDGLDLNIWANV